MIRSSKKSTPVSIARIASCATVGTELVLTRLANCINYVDRRLCGRRLSIVFVKVKGTVGIGTESERIAEPPLCSRGHAAASGCATRVPVMKPAEAG